MFELGRTENFVFATSLLRLSCLLNSVTPSHPSTKRDSNWRVCFKQYNCRQSEQIFLLINHLMLLALHFINIDKNESENKESWEIVEELLLHHRETTFRFTIIDQRYEKTLFDWGIKECSSMGQRLLLGKFLFRMKIPNNKLCNGVNRLHFLTFRSHFYRWKLFFPLLKSNCYAQSQHTIELHSSVTLWSLLL